MNTPAKKTMSCITNRILLVAIVSIATGIDANAQNFNWGPVPTNDDWYGILNWSGGDIFNSVPDNFNEAAIVNAGLAHSPTLFGNVNIGGLTIRPQASMDQNGFDLIVDTGAGTAGVTNLQAAGTLVVRSGPGRFDADELYVSGLLSIDGGFIDIDKIVDIRAGGSLQGHGLFTARSLNAPFANNNLIRASGGTLTINRTGSSTIDLDGNGGGAGILQVAENSTLRIALPLTDPFGNSISVDGGGVLRVDFGWAMNVGTIDLNGGRIEGGAFSVTGSAVEITTSGSSSIDSVLDMNAGTLIVDNGTLQFTGNASLGASAVVDIQSGAKIFVDAMFESSGADITGIELNVRDGGSFTMSDGNLGVFVLDLDPGSLFEMTGGRMAANLVEGSLEIDGGILAVGHSVRQMNVGGDFDQLAGSSLEIEIGGVDAGTQYDQILVTGDVTIAGSLDVQLLEPFMLENGQEFTIIDATGNVTGEFADLADGDLVGNFDGVDLFISYDGNSVSLFTEPDLVLGDVNLDGVVNLLDVAPFVELISAGTFQAEADINQDGVVNLLDVAPFVALLSGN